MTATSPASGTLELRSVCKRYGTGTGTGGQVTAANDVTFTIKAGAFVALTGASGLGQVHVAAHDWRDRTARLGHHHQERHRGHRAARRRPGRLPAHRRLRVPVATDPIFVVGMTRAGSTLVEQILASHSAIEGTKELAYIGLIARWIGRRSDDYHARLAALRPDQRHAYGEEYLELMRAHRRQSRPFFIDKMPNNWLHVPLIQLILPNAKIIDARRHPLACGFSNFRQHYARGPGVHLRPRRIGRYYRDYVRLMAHIDAVLPGARAPGHLRATGGRHRGRGAPAARLSRAAVRAGLPALPRNPRAVRHAELGAGAAADRAPRKWMQWRDVRQWLGPLKEALGPVLDAYPDVPEFTES